ncbi:hypothetical protein IFM89_014288 [Coptis chinensis]|uniref:Uncharacterized protein n=1 Tax=Coptis chinensis TaxID=261450 RepID=A0A835HSN2_9MAGN|nr:hypothetical protein IFM89_014288 [Coptis chinensis]
MLLERLSSSLGLPQVLASGLHKKLFAFFYGQQLAYQYAKQGAHLVLVARRERSLQEVAEQARACGSPDVLVVSGDVSKKDDCKRFVEAAVDHFGKLDHLVNNAGITNICMFEEATDVNNFRPIMNDSRARSPKDHPSFDSDHDNETKNRPSSGAQGNGTVVEELNTSGHDTGADPSIGLQLALYVPAEITTPIETNFWGAIYPTYFAIPHLKNTRGKIIVTASAGGWFPYPRMAVYNASKAALINFYECLRVELGHDVGITIVTPGFVESEMTKGKHLSKEGTMVIDQEMRDVQIGLIPVAKAEGCAKAMLNGARRGDRYVTEPPWFKALYFWRAFCPEILEWVNRFLLITGTSERESLSKKIVNATGAKYFLYPASIQTSDVKTD